VWTLQDDRLYLCGMLAAEILTHGRESHQLVFAGLPVAAARVLVAVLAGAMLIARSPADPPRLRSAANRVLADLEVAM